MEVREGEWGEAPEYRFDSLECCVPGSESQRPYALEKLHPEFYAFDLGRFQEDLGGLEEAGSEVACVYLAREPMAALNSFVSYQRRDPQWYPGLEGADLTAHARDTFASLLQLARARPGLVLDYGAVRADLAGAMLRVYDMLWPGASEEDVRFRRDVAARAAKATARELRARSGSPFLGKTEGRAALAMAGADALHDLAPYKTDLERALESYEALIAMGSAGGSG